jgi:hypothetical protein
MDRGFQADEIGHESRQEGAHRVAQVAPEPVDTQARLLTSPAWQAAKRLTLPRLVT